MPVITLPDGSRRSFEQPVSVYEVAADIGAGLARAALAGSVDGRQVDTSFVIENDAELTIITERDAAGLDIIRHSTAHLLAMATQDLFADVQVTIGPVIEDGFYYDFATQRAFTPADLEQIEQRMAAIVRADLPVQRQVMSRAEAVRAFADLGEHYKVQIIEDLPADEDISIYRQGNWMDLCRGPHVPSTGRLKTFKLTRVAGAYWRGDARKEMLQRVYGTAWRNRRELDDYLQRVAAAEQRDHRKLGKQLGLFHLQEEAPGMVFWHPRGWHIYRAIEEYMRAAQRAHGYQEIKTPQIVALKLWQQSGHVDKFGDDMFMLQSEQREFAVKPMNCPCHVQVFNQGLRSYRDLPLRLAEFGSCHRNEPSGALHGLLRVRGFVQDDAHIFCTEPQIQAEVSAFIELLHQVYADFGFSAVIYRLATRPEQRVGTDADWDRAEQALADALEAQQLSWQKVPGEGAFYGPKIEFSLQDSIGRVWQLGTVQVDFSMPGRLGAQYVAQDGSRQVPVMLHRAILGSFERFIGILIEHYAGSFPPWLAPEQAAVLTITDRHRARAEEISQLLNERGFRVISDLRNEKVGFKIREHTLQHIPYLLVLGDRELADRTVAVRTRAGENLGAMAVEDFAAHLRRAVDARHAALGGGTGAGDSAPGD